MEEMMTPWVVLNYHLRMQRETNWEIQVRDGCHARG